jgi:hypothetical protein
VIHTVLDACQFVLETEGEPQSPYWLSSMMIEMRLWKASEQTVRAALEEDIARFRERSRFVGMADSKYALKAWPRTS